MLIRHQELLQQMRILILVVGVLLAVVPNKKGGCLSMTCLEQDQNEHIT